MKLKPLLSPSTYVFAQVDNLNGVTLEAILCMFRESEGITLVLKKADAVRLGIPFDYEAAWISLQLETELEMVGLTAEFSTALADEGISCNVIAAYNHDHIFVALEDANQAMEALQSIDL